MSSIGHTTDGRQVMQKLTWPLTKWA